MIRWKPTSYSEENVIVVKKALFKMMQKRQKNKFWKILSMATKINVQNRKCVWREKKNEQQFFVFLFIATNCREISISYERKFSC